MSLNLPIFVRDLCEKQGIPVVHHSAVVYRAEAARASRDALSCFTPLRGAGPAILIVSSLDGVENEIDAADRALCRRVVARAADDHARGVLERRIAGIAGT